MNNNYSAHAFPRQLKSSIILPHTCFYSFF
ncbi:unnamed protein product [Oikopleura dioica]|uniref:Uncharacterized protein n=1 Tax=Oikopleura dioica TaxID=34765 RepID=E4XER2_OIKDI|nr:unnamed protein product [Oikopleura dioica]